MQARFVSRTCCALAILATLVFASNASAVLVLSGGGLTLVEQAGTFDLGNLAPLGTPFAPNIEGQNVGPPQPIGYGGAHTTTGVNNGVYGNAGAWLAGSPGSHVGIGFPVALPLSSIAFGRSNVTSGDPCGGGVCTDRNLGLYTLQYTQVLSPDHTLADTGIAATGWETIGTLDYVSAGGLGFGQPWRRHRYNFNPVSASGIRLVTAVPGTGIDEIELYEAAGPYALPPVVILSPKPGYAIAFNGNNGLHSSPDNPALVPDNLALATNGATHFASSALGEQYAFDPPANIIHQKPTINDGQYGNTHSWIGGDGDTNPSIGVDLGGLFAVTSVAWGRDNGNIAGDTGCGGGICMDRTLGTYTLQYTQIGGADHLTPESGDPAMGWTSIAMVEYTTENAGVFDSWLRHEFDVFLDNGNRISAAGIRLKVPGSGIGGAGTAVDELEVYGERIPEPSSFVLAGVLAGLALVVRRVRR